MTKVWTLAKHEYRAAVRSKALSALLATFIIVTAVSILIAAFTYKSKLADYNVYKAAAQAAKATYIAGPQLFPLQLLRGAIEYVEIIGSVIAIALGSVSVARECPPGQPVGLAHRWPYGLRGDRRALRAAGDKRHLRGRYGTSGATVPSGRAARARACCRSSGCGPAAAA